jgi:hypothetical protein
MLGTTSVTLANPAVLITQPALACGFATSPHSATTASRVADGLADHCRRHRVP